MTPHWIAGKTVLKLMWAVTGIKPKVWGTSMIGFGSYDYTTASFASKVAYFGDTATLA